MHQVLRLPTAAEHPLPDCQKRGGVSIVETRQAGAIARGHRPHQRDVFIFRRLAWSGAFEEPHGPETNHPETGAQTR